MPQAPTPPPQRSAQGGRRTLDAQWLKYVSQTSDVGDSGALAANNCFNRGVDEFNEGRFQASHETWESLWIEASYPQRLFLLALTKLGAGFAHALRRNPRGVQRLLEDSVRFAGPFGPRYAGLDVERLIADMSAWLAFGVYDPPFPRIVRARPEP